MIGGDFSNGLICHSDLSWRSQRKSTLPNAECFPDNCSVTATAALRQKEGLRGAVLVGSGGLDVYHSRTG